MKRWILFAVLLTGLSVLTSGWVRPEGVAAYMVCDDGHCVHENIVAYATYLVGGEFNDYFSDVQDGAGHEDLKDHIWDIGSPCTTNTHFWDADDPDPNNPVDEAISCTSPNAWQKAHVLWGMALGEYHSGDKVAAYEYLGHVAHLLSDMTVPAHAHEDMHPSADAFEDWMTQAVAELSQSELDGLVGAGPVEIPDGPYLKLDWLFYTTNQVGDFYASDDSDGDSNDPLGWAADLISGLENNPESNDPECRHENGFELGDCDLDIVRKYSYFHAIRAVAALLELFDEQRKQQADLAVVIDHVEQLQGHGATDDPDYYVWVSIGGQPFRNEGDQQETATTIDPGWAFGWNVGLTGATTVVIELWDSDPDAESDDDFSDISPLDDDRSLALTVNLDLCVAGLDGAVSGDVAGACGPQITSEGGEDDASRITFRILAPNAPPTADAGPDQTVDEGDLVTLNGSFTDPNAEDTHTFLWHLESSTNGQAVPDAYTDSLSFTPIDDGVYTFTFTVTDNHGAQGSDTVVVTAENVPPVASIDSLTDEYDEGGGSPIAVALLALDVVLEGSFTDAGIVDTHTASLDWGDGEVYTQTDFDSFSDSLGGVTGTAAATYAYLQTGTFDITFTVTDKDAGEGAATVQIEVIDAKTAAKMTIDDLRDVVNSLSRFSRAAPAIRNAIADLWKVVNCLELGSPYGALVFISRALDDLTIAESRDPTLDLSPYKEALAEMAKSEAYVAIAEAGDGGGTAKAEHLAENGDALLAAGDYRGAVGMYRLVIVECWPW